MKNTYKLGALALVSSFLAACNDSDNNSTAEISTAADALFNVQITNLTHAQPLSPVAVMMHKSGFFSFKDGETASLALEALAEGGNNADILSEVQASIQHVASASTDGPVAPQSASTVTELTVPADYLSDLRLSVISMLVHTNDGFTGANALNISDMAIGDSLTVTGLTWDSGTEANSETASTLPGPDFSGQGFNVLRDDLIDRVRLHQGAVTNEDTDFGLATSSLKEQHRFLNPTSRIVVTRTQ